MRHTFSRRLAVLLVVVSMVAPAYAVPRQDDGSTGRSLIERIVKIIRRIVPLDTVDAQVNFPKP